MILPFDTVSLVQMRLLGIVLEYAHATYDRKTVTCDIVVSACNRAPNEGENKLELPLATLPRNYLLEHYSPYRVEAGVPWLRKESGIFRSGRSYENNGQ